MAIHLEVNYLSCLTSCGKLHFHVRAWFQLVCERTLGGLTINEVIISHLHVKCAWGRVDAAIILGKVSCAIFVKC